MARSACKRHRAAGRKTCASLAYFCHNAALLNSFQRALSIYQILFFSTSSPLFALLALAADLSQLKELLDCHLLFDVAFQYELLPLLLDLGFAHFTLLHLHIL